MSGACAQDRYHFRTKFANENKVNEGHVVLRDLQRRLRNMTLELKAKDKSIKKLKEQLENARAKKAETIKKLWNLKKKKKKERGHV